MNTKLLLVLVACFAFVTAIASASALYLVLQEGRDYQQLVTRIEAIEVAMKELNRPEQVQPPQSAELSATLTLLFKRLDAHERALDTTVGRLSDLVAPNASQN